MVEGVRSPAFTPIAIAYQPSWVYRSQSSDRSLLNQEDANGWNTHFDGIG